jgi:hypothetical protein
VTEQKDTSSSFTEKEMREKWGRGEREKGERGTGKITKIHLYPLLREKWSVGRVRQKKKN